jgi:hypothetical protein
VNGTQLTANSLYTFAISFLRRGMMKAGSILAVFLGLILVLSACASTAPATSPTASPSSTPSPSTSVPPTSSAAPTTAPSGPYIGLPSAIVDGIYALMKGNLGVDVTIAQEDFYDSISKQGGWGQALNATGTGNDFASPAITAQILATILENEGWKVDPQLAADGPMGTALGYRKDKALALIEVNWQPDSSITVDPSKPIESQEIPLDKQLYSVKLSLATLP